MTISWNSVRKSPFLPWFASTSLSQFYDSVGKRTVSRAAISSIRFVFVLHPVIYSSRAARLCVLSRIVSRLIRTVTVQQAKAPQSRSNLRVLQYLHPHTFTLLRSSLFTAKMTLTGSIVGAIVLLKLISIIQAQNAELYVAADNLADVYLNGDLVAKTYDWKNFVRYSLTVKSGDVIAVEASDLGVVYGVIAALVSGNKKCVTRVNRGPWRAVLSANVLNEDWKCKGFDSSLWSFPSAATVTPPNPGTAPKFPYQSTGAQYVWARGGGVNYRVALRLVVTSACV